MPINNDDVQRVIDEADIVAVIQRRVNLKRKGGSNWTGLCPFHTEKTPSFSVSQDKGLYHCFGCKASGNVFTFLSEVEHLDFVTAIEQLAEMLGIKLRYEGGGDGMQRQRNKQLTALLDQAAQFYHRQLMTSPAARRARSYLRTRGYDKAIVVKYQIGYATNARTSLTDELLGGSAGGSVGGSAGGSQSGSPGATPELLLEANLAWRDDARPPAARPGQASDKPVLRDRFFDRVMFPIRDLAGNTVGFGGRQLPDGRDPKYLNSSQTAVYDKSRVLYGLDSAKRAISSQGFVLICEGYTDVIGFSIAGFENAVATCGTALTEQHVRSLVKFTKRFVLAFDSDGAGQAAAERFHQLERKYELEVAVVELPAGEDPGQLAINDAAALHQAVEVARPYYLYRADRVLASHDLTQPITRGRAADELAKVMAVYPADLVGEADVAPLAKRLPMETADFMERVAKARELLAAQDAEQAERAKREAARGRSVSGGNTGGHTGRGGGRDRSADPGPSDEYDPGPSDEPGDEYEYTGQAPRSSGHASDGRAFGGQASDGHAFGGQASGGPAPRSADRTPFSPAEIGALQALEAKGQDVLPYLRPEVFEHSDTQAAFTALRKQLEGTEPTEADQRALTAYANARNSVLMIEQDELSEEDIWRLLSAAMAAAIKRKSLEKPDHEHIQADVGFRERMVPALLEELNDEVIRELLAEAAEWIDQYHA